MTDMNSTDKRVAVVIPARYESSRFPGKALAKIAGRPMIEWVYTQAMASIAEQVIVATDDQRIVDCVKSFGGEAVLTHHKHLSGTDRIAEVAKRIDAEINVNLQGDEPLMDPYVINGLIEFMGDRLMATVAVPIRSNDPRFSDPHVVKVVLDQKGDALYFSRLAIPYNMNAVDGAQRALKHLGLYAYRRDFLQHFIRWSPGNLEKKERLEQLRALENGIKIGVMITEHDSIAVDIPEDIATVEQLLARLGR